MPESDLEIMRRLDRLHLEFPFARYRDWIADTARQLGWPLPSDRHNDREGNSQSRRSSPLMAARLPIGATTGEFAHPQTESAACQRDPVVPVLP